jgi:hypothetical protein
MQPNTGQPRIQKDGGLQPGFRYPFVPNSRPPQQSPHTPESISPSIRPFNLTAALGSTGPTGSVPAGPATTNSAADSSPIKGSRPTPGTFDEDANVEIQQDKDTSDRPGYEAVEAEFEVSSRERSLDTEATLAAGTPQRTYDRAPLLLFLDTVCKLCDHADVGVPVHVLQWLLQKFFVGQGLATVPSPQELGKVTKEWFINQLGKSLL